MNEAKPRLSVPHPLVMLAGCVILAALAAAGVRYEEWIKFAMPLYLALVVLGAVSIAIAIAIGLA
jgi:uncharacterized ion transporter superfamily protein YfcC